MQDFDLEDVHQVDCDQRGLLTEDIYTVIQETKNGKAVDVESVDEIDAIPAEFLKILYERALKKLVELCNI